MASLPVPLLLRWKSFFIETLFAYSTVIYDIEFEGIQVIV